MTTESPRNHLDLVVDTIRSQAVALEFVHVGITDIRLDIYEARLEHWLAEAMHGDMDYMARHGRKRSRPDELIPGTRRVITVALPYMSQNRAECEAVLNEPGLAYISRYAVGRDYHKILRKRLQLLCDAIQRLIGPFGYRVFVDSGPVLEKPLAEKSGIGWIGKHANIINRHTGSWFFLGEILTDLELPVTAPSTPHCGTCTACMDVCPTQAIVAPYVVDARRCISYLTIEHHGSIPLEFRPQIGNRIYGCDDCQLVCPWNSNHTVIPESEFSARHGLDSARLTELFSWSEGDFNHRLEGSPIRRIGHERWLRNIAVALGNSAAGGETRQLLEKRAGDSSALVAEHARWALQQLDARGRSGNHQPAATPLQAGAS